MPTVGQKAKGKRQKAKGRRQKAEHALERAYRQTTYAAEIDGVTHSIRIGRRHRKLDQQLQSTDATTWACITAWNPQSQRLSRGENARRDAALKRVLHERKIRWHPMSASGDAGDWPTEQGVLALGITRATARGLGRQFEQLAVVWGRVGGEAELVWCARFEL